MIEGIAALKSLGISVTLSPFLLMDVPPGNGLPDPYGRAEQPPFPWRGRIKVSQDGTAQARAEIADFVGEDGAYGFRHFILHHARLAKRAGGVDAFLIGSEMVALTRVRDDQNRLRKRASNRFLSGHGMGDPGQIFRFAKTFGAMVPIGSSAIG